MVLISSILAYNFDNTGIWFHQYQYMILSIPVYTFINTRKWFHSMSSIWVYEFVNTKYEFVQFHQFLYTILIYDFVNTGIRFRQYWRRYIFNCLIFYFCTYLLTNFSVGQTHKRLVHERVRNFACNFCDYRTVNNSQLANHIRYVQTYQLAIPARIIEEERDGG